ncbi:MAG: hypothetical protein KIB00_16175 [Paeniclostridium sordellii]|nr:hypothetical protein [Paeniclostridium sordellii]
MAHEFKKLPSEVLGITDSLAKYCFDEACSYILRNLREGRELKDDKTTKTSNSMDAYLEYMQSLDY